MICALALDQLGEERAGQRDEPGDVGVDHILDPLPVGLGKRIGRRGKAGIVEQKVDLAPGRVELGQAFHGGPVAHVDLKRQERIAELLLQLSQAFAAAARADDVPSSVGEASSPRPAETCGRARDQDGLAHASPRSFDLPPRGDEFVGPTPIASETASKSGSCASRKRSERREAPAPPLAAVARLSQFRSGPGTAPRAVRRSASQQAPRARARKGRLASAAAWPTLVRHARGGSLAKILIVEDNALNIKLFCDLLAAHGHEPEAVTDSRFALDAARQFSPTW